VHSSIGKFHLKLSQKIVAAAPANVARPRSAIVPL
jgi:hypothetical protein